MGCKLAPTLLSRLCLGTMSSMEHTLFELTPEQQDFLAALSRQTGKAIPTLLAEALEGLAARVRLEESEHATNGSPAEERIPKSAAVHKPIWAQFVDAFNDVPEEEQRRLPVDGAAQHDHYIYGTPKRPT
jgi:hypothetical protein